APSREPRPAPPREGSRAPYPAPSRERYGSPGNVPRERGGMAPGVPRERTGLPREPGALRTPHATPRRPAHPVSPGGAPPSARREAPAPPRAFAGASGRERSTYGSAHAGHGAPAPRHNGPRRPA